MQPNDTTSKTSTGDAPATLSGPSGGSPAHGQHRFSLTYDDTGETTTVDAPNGWTMQRVVDTAYEQLGEPLHSDDRVEYGDGIVLTAEQRALHVKAFLEAGLNPSGKFHIVSRPGGARP